jgi:hypothetical protein
MAICVGSIKAYFVHDKKYGKKRNTTKAEKYFQPPSLFFNVSKMIMASQSEFGLKPKECALA